MNKQIKNTPSSKSEKINAPNPEVPTKRTRRKFTAQYKLRILEQADNYKLPGELSDFLHREGLYSYNL